MCRNWKLPGLAHLCSKGAHEPNSISLTPPYPPPRPELPIYGAAGLVPHPVLCLLVPPPPNLDHLQRQTPARASHYWSCQCAAARRR